MKYKYFVLLIFVSSLTHAEIFFPDYLYVIHKETGYKILLGTSPRFIEKYFGKPNKKELKFQFVSPDYEIWDMIYDNFEIRYQTLDVMITGIKIRNDNFYTSKNIKVGSTISEVINHYGHPTYTYTNSEGVLIYLYEQYIKEINSEGLYTVIQFNIEKSTVVEILLDIVTSI
jgi:hypothetical protein